MRGNLISQFKLTIWRSMLLPALIVAVALLVGGWFNSASRQSLFALVGLVLCCVLIWRHGAPRRSS